MSKSHQVIRIVLLVLLPFVLVLPPYLAYRTCSILHFASGSESTSCGWPFALNTIQATDSGPLQIINYLGLSGDIIVWLFSIAVWAILFKYFGSAYRATVHQIARKLFLILVPLVLVLTPYFSSINCIDASGLFLSDSAFCGWPFPYETLHVGYAGKWGELNSFGLSADIVLWLAGLAIWIAVLRYRTEQSNSV